MIIYFNLSALIPNAGKDRSSVLCALILSLAGVADNEIAEEYHLSDLGYVHCYEEMIKKLMTVPKLSDNRKLAESLASAK